MLFIAASKSTIYEIWQNVNDLDADGLLRYPTEAYVRSVMNLHASWESLMETFVGFVTVIESLLTPGTRQDLKYLTALRGAALLASAVSVAQAVSACVQHAYRGNSDCLLRRIHGASWLGVHRLHLDLRHGLVRV